MGMHTFTKIKSHCMKYTVTYNIPFMYTSISLLNLLYTVCNIKNKTFDAGPLIFLAGKISYCTAEIHYQITPPYIILSTTSANCYISTH